MLCTSPPLVIVIQLVAEHLQWYTDVDAGMDAQRCLPGSLAIHGEYGMPHVSKFN